MVVLKTFYTKSKWKKFSQSININQFSSPKTCKLAFQNDAILRMIASQFVASLIGQHDEHLCRHTSKSFLEIQFRFIILLWLPSYGLPNNSFHELGKCQDLLLSNCKLMYKLDLREEFSHSSMGYSLLLPSLASPYSPSSELQQVISSHHQITQGRKHKKLLEGRRNNIIVQ